VVRRLLSWPQFATTRRNVRPSGRRPGGLQLYNGSERSCTCHRRLHQLSVPSVSAYLIGIVRIANDSRANHQRQYKRWYAYSRDGLPWRCGHECSLVPRKLSANQWSARRGTYSWEALQRVSVLIRPRVDSMADACASIWLRCVQHAGPGVQRRFIETMQEFFQSISEQAKTRAENTFPDLESYIDCRRDTSGG
jgi:hypothetical protein